MLCVLHFYKFYHLLLPFIFPLACSHCFFVVSNFAHALSFICGRFVVPLIRIKTVFVVFGVYFPFPLPYTNLLLFSLGYRTGTHIQPKMWQTNFKIQICWGLFSVRNVCRCCHIAEVRKIEVTTIELYTYMSTYDEYHGCFFSVIWFGLFFVSQSPRTRRHIVAIISKLENVMTTFKLYYHSLCRARIFPHLYRSMPVLCCKAQGDPIEKNTKYLSRFNVPLDTARQMTAAKQYRWMNMNGRRALSLNYQHLLLYCSFPFIILVIVLCVCALLTLSSFWIAQKLFF